MFKTKTLFPTGPLQILAAWAARESPPDPGGTQSYMNEIKGPCGPKGRSRCSPAELAQTEARTKCVPCYEKLIVRFFIILNKQLILIYKIILFIKLLLNLFSQFTFYFRKF